MSSDTQLRAEIMSVKLAIFYGQLLTYVDEFRKRGIPCSHR